MAENEIPNTPEANTPEVKPKPALVHFKNGDIAWGMVNEHADQVDVLTPLPGLKTYRTQRTYPRSQVREIAAVDLPRLRKCAGNIPPLPVRIKAGDASLLPS